MKATVIVLSLIVIMISGTALAQPAWPNGWIDLQADSILYDFPYPDTISITVHFSIRSGMLVDAAVIALKETGVCSATGRQSLLFSPLAVLPHFGDFVKAVIGMIRQFFPVDVPFIQKSQVIT